MFLTTYYSSSACSHKILLPQGWINFIPTHTVLSYILQFFAPTEWRSTERALVAPEISQQYKHLDEKLQIYWVQREKCQKATLVLCTEHSTDWQHHDLPCYNKFLVISPGQTSVVTLLLINSHFPIHVMEANHSTISKDAFENIKAEIQRADLL